MAARRGACTFAIVARCCKSKYNNQIPAHPLLQLLPAEPTANNLWSLRWLHRPAAVDKASDSGLDVDIQASSALQQQAGQHAEQLLQGLKGLHLKEQIAHEAGNREFLQLGQFFDLAKSSGAAASDAEAHELLLTLHRSGVVLRHLDIVYLRPELVARSLLQALPGNAQQLQSQLQQAEQELAHLDAKHEEISRRAQRRASIVLWTGCSMLVAQLVGFIYLTWWELSWDVMEPVAYIISLFYSLVGFLFFLTRNTEFEYGPFKEHWATRSYQKQARRAGFDRGRHQQLLQLVQRYRGQLAAMGSMARRV